MIKIVFILSFTSLLISCDNTELENSLSKKNIEVVKTIKQPVSVKRTYGLIWHYNDDFNEDQKATLEKWITDVHIACTATLGAYPFDMNVHFHKSTSKSGPVPFAHTRRSQNHELHFYVNPTSTYKEYIKDWTAQHEMSHLSIPYVVKKYKWFSEGYATYMSRRIMINQGFYTEKSFDKLYLNKIKSKKKYFTNQELSFSDVCAKLLKQYKYGAIYWGGAGFFYKADKLLQEQHNVRLEDLIKEYQVNYRMKDKNYSSIIRSFDKIIESSLFDKLSNQYENGSSMEVMKSF